MNFKIAYSTLLLVLMTSLHSSAQIFPDLTDQPLIDALAATYKPASVLSLSQAKDTLYAIIDNDQDTVRGIYSGYALHLPQGTDPSQWVFMDGDGINLEHSWPRSKGASEGTQGHSDMYHLFPSRVAVNSARASNPFADIPDASTTAWFYLDMQQSGIPASNIDAYAEATKSMFEPRESVKGDIARAAFYFYTMYQDAADAADPDYFEGQRSTLLQWHEQDPVDAAELERSAMIAVYQDGKENPFVLDATLAERAFCNDPPCSTTAVDQPSTSGIRHFMRGCSLVMEVDSWSSAGMHLGISTTDGRLIATYKTDVQAAGTVELDLCALGPGMYIAHAVLSSGKSPARSTFKFLIRG